MKRYIIALIILALPLCLRAQQSEQIIPSVLSPNSAELGKYGKVPVSYFNGLPNISIPLTEVRAKNYSVPVYLTYHAGGNKPEQHPGWVGLGWTLHAGGCINRIVNGLKDEMCWKEYCATFFRNVTGSNPYTSFPSTNPGYLSRMNHIQSTDWTDTDNLEEECDLTEVNYYLRDFSPDEFQVNIEDINASFYFVGNNQIKIVSKDPVDFTAELIINTDEDLQANSDGTLVLYSDDATGRLLKVHLYHYIEQLILTKSDGTKYYFGGNQDAIEFSAHREWFASSSAWDAIGSANSWMLTKIVRPDGEEITFEYAHDGVPIVRSDCHTYIAYYQQSDNNYLKNEWVNTFQPSYQNVSYTMLYPCYLTSINSKIAGDSITITREDSSELSDQFRSDEFAAKIGSSIQGSYGSGAFSKEELWAKNYYKRLKKMTKPSQGEIQFTYENTSTERLRLGAVTFYGYNGSGAHSYQMDYNSIRLPAYGSKQTDAWGYYNGMVFGQSLTDTLNINYNKTLFDSSLMKAEILEKISYPTGGYTTFEYEPHGFGKVATQFPFTLVTQSGQAGGLRIHRITDNDGVNSTAREFVYEKNGSSTGILSGAPKFHINGNVSRTTWKAYPFAFWFNPVDHIDLYEIYKEFPLVQLSTTGGNHVTYSEVKEVREDGSYTIYTYSNHDTSSSDYLDEYPAYRYENADNRLENDVYTSRELMRGNLLSRKDYRADGKLVMSEQMTYNYNLSDYVKSLGVFYKAQDPFFLLRLAYQKIYSFFPYLSSRTVTTYSDEGTNNAHSETTTYEYDSHRNLTKTTVATGTVRETVTTTYPGNYAIAPYPDMRTRGIYAAPVETVKSKGGLVTSASLNEYFHYPDSDRYGVSSVFGRTFPEGTDSSSFSRFTGRIMTSPSYSDIIPDAEVLRRDSLLNPESIILKDGTIRGYVWGGGGMYPVMVCTGAANSRRTVPVTADVEDMAVYQLYDDHSDFTLEYESIFPAQVTVTLEGAANQNWAIHGEVDAHMVSLVKIQWPSGAQNSPWPSYQQSYTDSYTSSFSATNHYVSFEVMAANGSGFGSTPGIVKVYYTHAVTTDVTTGTDDLFHEDFEGYSSSTTTGWNSSKGYTGSFTVMLPLRDTSRSFVIDYRQKTGNGAWTYVRDTFSGSATIGGTGKVIDEVRVYPADSEVTSYTYDFTRGLLLSETDTRGVTTSYEYDSLGRLSAIKDNGGNTISQYTYHYKPAE